MPADLRVLLAVVRGVARSPEDHGLDVALGQVSDWDALVDSALRHGLVAQLHAALESAPELTQAVVPGETRAGLASLAGAIAVRSLRMTRQLLLLLERLHAAGIPALAVKGPALSQLAYGEPTLRRFVDLDILVRPSDVCAARAVVEAAGLVA
ncbi:MAG TPA: nucleotidyltransferase family protein, partial [Thermoleophilia bacterium]